MDMSFARRSRQNAVAPAASPELTRLLAQVAARQALSPTACADAAISGETRPAQARLGVDLLGGAREPRARAVSASFNPEIAKSMQTLGKSL